MIQSVYIIQCPPVWLKTPPLSLIYLKTYLKNQGLEVKTLDLNMAMFQASNLKYQDWLPLNSEFESELFETLNKAFPRLFDFLYRMISLSQVIGFSLLKRNAGFSFALANQIKQRFPDKKIVFGGPHTLFLDKANQLNDSDYWVIGEGEIPLTEITYGSKQKVWRFKEIEDLDAFPFFDLTDFNPKAYSQTIPLLSSRGCPFGCSFCSEKLLFKKVKRHSPRYILEQIKYLISRYDTKSFVFCDSLINSSNQWLSEFCQLLIKDNLNITWEAQFRITKDFDIEIAKLMKRSGCYNLFIGLESASNKVLTAMNKGFSADDAIDCFKKLKQAELHFEISLITGYPKESQEDFNQTLNFISLNRSIIPKIAQINPFVDYLNEFDQSSLEPTNNKVTSIVNLLEKEKIPYTKSFINNLVYGN